MRGEWGTRSGVAGFVPNAQFSPCLGAAFQGGKFWARAPWSLPPRVGLTRSASAGDGSPEETGIQMEEEVTEMAPKVGIRMAQDLGMESVT